MLQSDAGLARIEAFRQSVGDAAADLVFGDGGGTEDVHIEIIAHASVRARAAA
jgi:hypothetical protein